MAGFAFTFDTRIYKLGKICSKGHQYLDTGRCLRRVKGGHCVECQKERKKTPEYKAWIRNYRLRWYDKNKEKCIQKAREYRETERYKELRNSSERRESRKLYKRRKRLEAGCELRENLTLWTAIKNAGAPTVIQLLSKQFQEAKKQTRIEYLRTPEGKAEQKALAADYSRQRYKTDWRTNYIQKEKNQRKRKRNRYNIYVEKKSPEQAKARLLAFDNCCAYCGTSLTMLSVEFDHVIPSSNGGPDIWANIIPACHSCNQSKRAQDMTKWYKQQPFYSYERLKRIKDVLASTPYPVKQQELFQDWQIQH